jgi:hypothetical protein
VVVGALLFTTVIIGLAVFFIVRRRSAARSYRPQTTDVVAEIAPTYQCDKCKKSFGNTDDLLAHVAKNHA